MGSSTASSNKLLVLIGSGPGIGVATASLFASNGFDIALLSRDAERLKQDVQSVQSASSNKSIKVESFAIDVADHTALKSTLDKVADSLGSPEIVIYNAARVGPSQFGEFTAEELLQDFKVINVGIYAAAVWALPHLAESAKQGGQASFFLSASGIRQQPLNPFFSLSMQKAAQCNFLKSFDQIAGPKGVHVAYLDINGIVSPEDKYCSPKLVAEEHWRLYQQERAQWEHVGTLGSLRELAKAVGIEWQDYQ
jgi:short-subunit dehydrogenase